MFPFHRPKVYRSVLGCCICRAKSSSSRFTDSKRYETDFIKCFTITERRSGEICNACVLLVKRWKKLPANSLKHWHHVVDARAGPGTKSMNKIKNKAKQEENLLKKKHKHKKIKKTVKKNVSTNGTQTKDEEIIDLESGDDDRCSQTGSYVSNSDASSETSSHGKGVKRLGRKRASPQPLQCSSFLDPNYWRREETCCGPIFWNPKGVGLVDQSLLHPCTACKPSAGAASKSGATASIEATSNLASPLDEDQDQETPNMDLVLNDPANYAEDYADDDTSTDMEEEEIAGVLALEQHLIRGNMELEDEGTDSGLGSQEPSTAETSPHPILPVQMTAADMLTAMSTGDDLYLSPPETLINSNIATDSATMHPSAVVQSCIQTHMHV